MMVSSVSVTGWRWAPRSTASHVDNPLNRMPFTGVATIAPSLVRKRLYETGDPTYLAYTFYGNANLQVVTQ
ncbi:hypothetical protein EN829_027815 [Mesorhizobium sp. M00.F.Ca.ET.186.01.1.1]|nr:hypothetical protein EN848_26990 [bacterium M00.F.Ca.ET.205.01.1.1]TGU48078.1 hypothetical protein EN795_28270 [bacterium M00.F.Ca.ET.152.01.1.1]TGV32320.1 hypothetical protein EN829_027815 [Mesorhizobium sp. M00.F.Ca.ET.186.01.1.1]TGZ39529.1 hypothetical protein EN805_27665 [bacterium M00.F.Ca.ET.162.01.1.1]